MIRGHHLHAFIVAGMGLGSIIGQMLDESSFRGWLYDDFDIGPPPPSANARILVSRNKREGRYCGRVTARWRGVSEGSQGLMRGPSGHWRAGGGATKQMSLRDWSRA